MPARDQTYATLNYEHVGGAIWHVGGTLEIGDNAVFGRDATTGDATLTGLATADPHVVGALWNSAGVVTISAG